MSPSQAHFSSGGSAFAVSASSSHRPCRLHVYSVCRGCLSRCPPLHGVILLAPRSVASIARVGSHGQAFGVASGASGARASRRVAWPWSAISGVCRAFTQRRGRCVRYSPRCVLYTQCGAGTSSFVEVCGVSYFFDAAFRALGFISSCGTGSPTQGHDGDQEHCTCGPQEDLGQGPDPGR